MTSLSSRFSMLEGSPVSSPVRAPKAPPKSGKKAVRAETGLFAASENAAPPATPPRVKTALSESSYAGAAAKVSGTPHATPCRSFATAANASSATKTGLIGALVGASTPHSVRRASVKMGSKGVSTTTLLAKIKPSKATLALTAALAADETKTHAVVVADAPTRTEGAFSGLTPGHTITTQRAPAAHHGVACVEEVVAVEEDEEQLAQDARAQAAVDAQTVISDVKLPPTSPSAVVTVPSRVGGGYNLPRADGSALKAAQEAKERVMQRRSSIMASPARAASPASAAGGVDLLRSPGGSARRMSTLSSASLGSVGGSFVHGSKFDFAAACAAPFTSPSRTILSPGGRISHAAAGAAASSVGAPSPRCSISSVGSTGSIASLLGACDVPRHLDSRARGSPAPGSMPRPPRAGGSYAAAHGFGSPQAALRASLAAAAAATAAHAPAVVEEQPALTIPEAAVAVNGQEGAGDSVMSEPPAVRRLGGGHASTHMSAALAVFRDGELAAAVARGPAMVETTVPEEPQEASPTHIAATAGEVAAEEVAPPPLPRVSGGNAALKSLLARLGNEVAAAALSKAAARATAEESAMMVSPAEELLAPPSTVEEPTPAACAPKEATGVCYTPLLARQEATVADASKATEPASPEVPASATAAAAVAKPAAVLEAALEDMAAVTIVAAAASPDGVEAWAEARLVPEGALANEMVESAAAADAVAVSADELVVEDVCSAPTEVAVNASLVHLYLRLPEEPAPASHEEETEAAESAAAIDAMQVCDHTAAAAPCATPAPAAAVCAITVPSFETRGGLFNKHTVYDITVTGAAAASTVQRRYREFLSLYEGLLARVPRSTQLGGALLDFTFPAKVAVASWRASVAEARCVGFRELTAILAAHMDVAVAAYPPTADFFGLQARGGQ